MTVYQEHLNTYRRSLAGHELVEREWSTEAVRAFRLQPPCAVFRTNTIDLVFLEKLGQIVIAGDLCPGTHGLVSTFGYGIGWFRGVKCPGYLAEKFLVQGWHQDLAREELVELAEELRADLDTDDEDAVEDLADALETAESCIEDSNWSGLADALTDIGVESEALPGWGPNPRDMALLRVINERFAALYVPAASETKGERS